MIKKLQQAGIQVLDWHTVVSLDQALTVALRQPTPLISLSMQDHA